MNPHDSHLIVSAFQKHSGQMKSVFSELSTEEVHGGVQESYVSLDGAPLPSTTDIYERITKIPGIEDIWQGHLALANDKNHNTDERMIAPIAPAQLPARAE
jgi:hypothetical protein